MASTTATAVAAALASPDEQPEEYILTTATHNYVSTRADLPGSKQIDLRGRSIVRAGAQIRGDLAWVRVGRYTVLNENSRLEPPPVVSLGGDTGSTSTSPQVDYIPVTIGSYTTIGTAVHSQAAAIGSSCWIGAHVRLGPRVIIKDGCVVADGVSIPADTVVPPFTRVFEQPINGKEEETAAADQPCRRRRLEWMELPPSITVELQERAMQVYQEFVAEQQKRKRAFRGN